MAMTRRFHVGLTLGAGALVVALALAGPWRARAASALPTCSAAKLHLKFIDFQGATGHRYWDFAYKNTGPKCTIKGYPKVVLLNSHGHPLSDKVHHLVGSHAKAVTIAHNGRAFFTFQYADSGFCPTTPAVVAQRFKIFAPGVTSGTVFNPLPKNMGAPSICKGSEQVWPLRGKLSPSARDAASPICTSANLRLDRIGGQGFTSHQEIAFALRNMGSKTCHLKGYPGVGLLDKNAKLLAPAVTRVGGSAPAVVLGPWKRAYFNFTYTVAGPCIPHVLNVYGLQVIPPNTTSNLRFYLGKTSMCGPDPNGTVTSVSTHPGP